MFPINAAALPLLRTKQALLILDLQNDFVQPDGALPVTEPVGFVSRALELAKAFRESGAGDVIWIRSAFESGRPLSADGDQIVISDVPAGVRGRGRQRTSGLPSAAAVEADEEAFLSVPVGGSPTCVIPQTSGSEFAAEVQAAVDTNRDIVFTKSHYSPFASGQQLLQLLRGRLVTEMYVCGALTNVSIYATALDAAKHGYAMTVVEDCCGYRKETRHANAVRQLVQLTGSEVMKAADVIARLQPPPSGNRMAAATSRKRGQQAAPSRPVAVPRNEPTGLAAAVSRLSLSSGETSGQQPPALASRSDSKAAVIKPLTPDVTPRKANRPIHVAAEPLIASPDETPRQAQHVRAEEKNAASAASGVELKEPTPLPTIAPDAIPSADGSSLHVDETERPAKMSRDSASSERQHEDGPKTKSRHDVPEQTVSGPIVSDPICEGDTTVITNVLPPSLAADAFERLMKEVSWAGMSHLGGEVPRRVAVQGIIDDEGSFPIYRHPSDESPQLLPFSPTVLAIRAEVQKHLRHPLNHVLIQHYRGGVDYISEHSDKTLDVVPGSFIANLSLGAERTMVYRTKRVDKDHGNKAEKAAGSGEEGVRSSSLTISAAPSRARSGESATAPGPARRVERAVLPHNSLCRMGLTTNMRWLHSIRQDKRLDRDKTPAELAHHGERISLTFRHIGTFLDATQSRIWGQGATAKTREAARSAISGQTPEAIRMLQAFGAENNHAEFDWAGYYGGGFDVLHMGVPKRFCAGTDSLLATRVALALADLGISYGKGHVQLPGGEIRFEDNDAARTVTTGHAATLLYLDAWYARGKTLPPQQDFAAKFTRFQAALDLLGRWRILLAEAGVTEMKEKDGKKEGEKVVELEQEIAATKVEQGETKPSKRDSDEAETKAASTGTDAKTAHTKAALLKATKRELAIWQDWAGEVMAANSGANGSAESQLVGVSTKGGSSVFIAGGDRPSIADYALWPVLHDMVHVCGEAVLGGTEAHLGRYYASFGERSSVAKALHMLRRQ